MALNPFVHYQSKTQYQASSLKCIIEVAIDGVSILMHDQKELVFIEEYNWYANPDWHISVQNTKEVILGNSILANYQGIVDVILRSRDTTLIPRSISLESQKLAMLSLVTGRQTNSISSVEMSPLNAQFVCSIPPQLDIMLKELTLKTKLLHNVALFTDRIYRKVDSNDKVYIQVHSNYFDILIKREGEIVLVNSFDFKTDKDFIYLLLSAVRQLEINRETLHLMVSGKITPSSKLYSQLKLYFANPFFETFKLASPVNDIEASHYPQIFYYSGICE